MLSDVQKARLAYQPSIPELLQNLSEIFLSPNEPAIVHSAVEAAFPHSQKLPSYTARKRQRTASPHPLRVGALFSGGQAAGGHNVLAGLFDGLLEIHPESSLLGILDGPEGLLTGRSQVLNAQAVDSVRNQGGFNLIGASRTKVETPEQFEALSKFVAKERLDALVIIGGDDSNTNAALLAEYFISQKIATRVFGVPKTIDGDLQSPDVEMSFGFDSATKTYSEMIGNIGRDALSAKKYYHFIKLMGRSASHIALECALKTCPNLVLIGEEKRSLGDLVSDVADLVASRAKMGKHYGLLLIPEGLIEFVPELKVMIDSLNRLLAQEKDPQKALAKLGGTPRLTYESLPAPIQKQLLFERDPHGNVQVSHIETEELLLELVKQELFRRSIKMNAVGHFFGYEGRSCLPTNFDANYCYALGLLAAVAARDRATGVLLALKHLHLPPSGWEPCASSYVSLLHLEERSGIMKPVIAKTLVDLKGIPFLHLQRRLSTWRLHDHYEMPGPIQFFGDPVLTDSVPLTISLKHSSSYT